MISVLLLAAGKSKRFGKNKLLLPLGGKPIFQWSLETLVRHPLVHEIFMITRGAKMPSVLFGGNQGFPHELASPPQGGGSGSPPFLWQHSLGNPRDPSSCCSLPDLKKRVRIISGGKSRQESVFRGLQILKKQNAPTFLLIHNAANPFVTEEEISRCFYLFQKNRTIDGVGMGRKISDTIKIITPPGNVQKTLDRNFLWQMETPQIVRFQPFYAAHQKARKTKFETTDDLSLLEWYGKKTAVIEASENNFKITTPRDYELAKIIVGDLPRNTHVGMAEDTHLFSRTHRGLHLGGIIFPQFPKLEADSDGDIVLHALAASISQALGKGSLGTFANPLFKKGVTDSRVYLQKILQVMKKQNYSFQNVGIHLQGQKPKIDPIADILRKSLASLLKLPEEKIGITAETGETGENKLRCIATVTLWRSS